jgi:hypothetical protein
MDKPKEMKYLGWANGWKETPEIVLMCQELGHNVFGRCKECGYYFNVDSSD